MCADGIRGPRYCSSFHRLDNRGCTHLRRSEDKLAVVEEWVMIFDPAVVDGFCASSRRARSWISRFKRELVWRENGVVMRWHRTSAERYVLLLTMSSKGWCWISEASAF